MNVRQLIMFVALAIAILVNSGCKTNSNALQYSPAPGSAPGGDDTGDNPRAPASDPASDPDSDSGPADDMSSPVPAGAIVLRSDLVREADGWAAGFSGYHEDNRDYINFRTGHTPGRGVLVAGVNFSMGLFLFLRRGLGPDDGIVAGQTYAVSYRIRFASRDSIECHGPGGSPGAAEVIAGAAAVAPEKYRDSGGGWHLNIETFGREPGFVAIGTVDNGRPCRPDQDGEYLSVERLQEQPARVQADAGGRIWLLLGIRPSHMGESALYFEHVEIKLAPL